MSAPSKNEDTSTKFNTESKRPDKKKKHRNRERREVSSLNSINFNDSYGSPIVSLSQVRDSVGSTHSSESESDIESLYSYMYIALPPNADLFSKCVHITEARTVWIGDPTCGSYY